MTVASCSCTTSDDGLRFTPASCALATSALYVLFSMSLRGKEERDHDRKENCLDLGGIVQTDARGRFDGCLYANHPITEVNA